MKKVKKRLKVINSLDMGMFGGYVMVLAGFSFNEALAKMRKVKTNGQWIEAFESKGSAFIDSVEWCAFSITYENTKTGVERNFYFIYLKNSFDFSDESYCKLAHEVLHICQFYLPRILNRDKEIEAEAYLHTHIMSKCLSIFRGDKNIVNLFNH